MIHCGFFHWSEKMRPRKRHRREKSRPRNEIHSSSRRVTVAATWTMTSTTTTTTTTSVDEAQQSWRSVVGYSVIELVLSIFISKSKLISTFAVIWLMCSPSETSRHKAHTIREWPQNKFINNLFVTMRVENRKTWSRNENINPSIHRVFGRIFKGEKLVICPSSQSLNPLYSRDGIPFRRIHQHSLPDLELIVRKLVECVMNEGDDAMKI